MIKENLELVKIKIDRLLTYIHDMQDNLKRSKTKIEEGIIINGKPVDNGKINQDLQKLETVAKKLNTIRNHCNQQIELEEKKQLSNTNLVEDK